MIMVITVLVDVAFVVVFFIVQVYEATFCVQSLKCVRSQFSEAADSKDPRYFVLIQRDSREVKLDGYNLRPEP